MKAFGIGLVLLVGLMIAAVGRFHGCEGKKYVPISGTVTAKEWVPAHEDTWFQTMIVDGNVYTIPHTDHVSDCWWIKVSGRQLRVNKEEFQKIQIGDYFSEPHKE